jgi:membrane fusion protein (multidrug efflux system)
MKKPMKIMLIVTLSLLGLIFGIKGFKTLMVKKYMSAARSGALVTVSAEKLTYQKWQPQLHVSGSLRAVQGVNVTAEVPGLVRSIKFVSGNQVNEAEVLVELNTDADVSLLNSLQALADLAEINHLRDKEQYAVKAVSKSVVDASLADFKSKEAQVSQQNNIIAKKIIRAPFSGKLGISAINEGQYLNPGDTIVTLQSLDPIYADFFVPQQALADLKLGQTISLTTDSYPDKKYTGKITAIDPKVDPRTRNLHIQATLNNNHDELLPGMFVSLDILTDDPKPYLTLPQTAISFNTYGEVVYVLINTGEEGKDPILTAEQVFVTTGEKRGDQVTILDGVKEGDLIVTSGQLKLKNGSRVTINNGTLPANNPFPRPIDE